jgi:hypothetical protein
VNGQVPQFGDGGIADSLCQHACGCGSAHDGADLREMMLSGVTRAMGSS